MEDKQTRDLLIELKVTVEHLTKRVEDALNRTDDRIEQLDARLRVLERYFWIAIGGLAIIQLALPYIRERFP